MNLAELERKLIAAARANPPSDRVPYAFEKRIMARLAAWPVADSWALWARALWRPPRRASRSRCCWGPGHSGAVGQRAGERLVARTWSRLCWRQRTRISPLIRRW